MRRPSSRAMGSGAGIPQAADDGRASAPPRAFAILAAEGGEALVGAPRARAGHLLAWGGAVSARQRLAPPAPAVPARTPVPSTTSRTRRPPLRRRTLARRDERRLRIASLFVFVLLWQLGASLADSRTLPDPLAVLARIGAETASLALPGTWR